MAFFGYSRIRNLQVGFKVIESYLICYKRIWTSDNISIIMGIELQIKTILCYDINGVDESGKRS